MGCVRHGDGFSIARSLVVRQELKLMSADPAQAGWEGYWEQLQLREQAKSPFSGLSVCSQDCLR